MYTGDVQCRSDRLILCDLQAVPNLVVCGCGCGWVDKGAGEERSIITIFTHPPSFSSSLVVFLDKKISDEDLIDSHTLQK
jgi:hypothetical protein